MLIGDRYVRLKLRDMILLILLHQFPIHQYFQLDKGVDNVKFVKMMNGKVGRLEVVRWWKSLFFLFRILLSQ